MGFGVVVVLSRICGDSVEEHNTCYGVVVTVVSSLGKETVRGNSEETVRGVINQSAKINQPNNQSF
jgi:hypothetical protein